MHMVIHGDDLTVLGRGQDFDWLRTKLDKGQGGACEVMSQGRLGLERRDDKTDTMINMIVTWADNGIQYEADQRHCEILIREFELGFAKGVDTPGDKLKPHEESDAELAQGYSVSANRGEG